MTRYAQHASKRRTSQRDKASPNQRKNSAGGYTFVLDSFGRLERFLILGCEGGTYYASESKLTKQNAKCIESCLNEDGKRTVDTIVAVSDSGRAPKNDPAIFALALAAAWPNDATRKAALDALPQVCRTGTHLFQFVQSVKEMRGWGRGLRRAIGRWYTVRKADNLAYQVVKYQSRDGISHRDVLRLAHIAGPRSVATDAVLRWAVAGLAGMGDRSVVRIGGKDSKYPAIDPSNLPRIVHGWEAMKQATSKAEAVKLITEYRLTHEMVLNQFKNHPEVWEALLPNMPPMAMIRNLGKMTSCGLLAPLSNAAKQVTAVLGDTERLRKARVHPVSVFLALDTYSQGRGKRGGNTWTPVPQVEDAAESAFYTSFDFIEPTGKNTLLAVDVSGSMYGRGWRNVLNGWSFPNISGMDIPPLVAAALMAMVTARVEKNYHLCAFDTGMREIRVTARTKLADAVKAFASAGGGGTDLSAPITWATANNVPVETFHCYTDNETWAGHIHPHQALRDHRNAMGLGSKLVVAGMTSTGFTIADPNDAGMLDVVGFDTAAPKIMVDFAREVATKVA